MKLTSKNNHFAQNARRSLRRAFFVFLAARILYSLWAIVVTQIVPAPLEPDPVLRPYQGQPALLEGLEGYLLGPWQRFDTMNYLQLANEGYQASTSVFPPLYPLLIRAVSNVMSALVPLSPAAISMIAALLVSNIALIGALALLHLMVSEADDVRNADRSILYLAFFPTGFFLFAGYSESLFLLFAIGAIYLADRGRHFGAGVAGFLAALTRLTGWVLCLPLAYSYVKRRSWHWRQLDWRLMAVTFPAIALLLFLWWRHSAGFPPLPEVYAQFWYQRTGVPGTDLWVALRSIVTGIGPRAGEMSLLLDFLVTILLIISAALTFRRLGLTYGLYSASLILFMLLPSSQLKPLYSYARYALVFFPTFILLAQVGQNPWLHRFILYISFILALFFSGQFFLWGWVG